MRSLMAIIISNHFRITKSKMRFYNDSIRLEQGTFEHQKEAEISNYFDEFKLENFSGRRVYIINDENSDRKDTLFYFHGGGYLNPITKYHWKFLRKIAKKLDLRIIVPIYERVPERTYKDEFPILEKVYLNFKGNNKNFFGGDSAGGGMAVGLCYWLNEKKIELPNDLFLFSPWLDVEMSNPEIEKVKPHAQMLGYGGLNTIGLMWADGNLRDKYCSPLHGDLEILPPVYIYTGTYDVLYPDTEKFVKLMNEKGKRISFRVYPKMEHVFIVYPFLREGRKAFKDLSTDYNNLHVQHSINSTK